MSRAAHQRSELESVLRMAEAQGWTVERGKKYFKMKCPNECKCFKTVHLTPSNPNYRRNLLGQLSRATCWKES